MPNFEEHNGFQLQIGDRNPHEEMMLHLWTNLGKILSRGSIAGVGFPSSVEEEEAGIASQDPAKSSAHFTQTRSQVRDGLRAIVEHSIDKFGIPMEKGLDVGCGASAEMVSELMKNKITDLSQWIQIDVNRNTVREARRSSGHRTDVRMASYLHLDRDLPDMKFDTVSGLSSLDATCFIETAVEQIRQALNDGGFLFHVQDVRPGMVHVYQELAREGVAQGVDGYKALIDGRLAGPSGTLQTGCQSVFFVQTPEGWVSVSEMFRRNLGRALADNGGFEILFNDWITARKRVQAGAKMARLYHMNALLGVDPRYIGNDAISAAVTVARKK